jgi:hypothetical protein
MGIEEDFYATVKLKTGEEIFAKVAASEEDERTLLIISNPVVVNQIIGKKGIVGYKIEPWLKTTSEDMFIINIEDIITLSESSDIDMIVMYQTYVRQSNKEKTGQSKLTRKMGYIANVNDAKDLLEKLYKNS